MIPYDMAKLATGADIGMGVLIAVRGGVLLPAFMLIIGIFGFTMVCALDPRR